jgi:hypothetical protein
MSKAKKRKLHSPEYKAEAGLRYSTAIEVQHALNSVD